VDCYGVLRKSRFDLMHCLALASVREPMLPTVLSATTVANLVETKSKQPMVGAGRMYGTVRSIL